MKFLFFCLALLPLPPSLFAQTNLSIDIGMPYPYESYSAQDISREAIGLGVGFPVHRYGEVRAGEVKNLIQNTRILQDFVNPLPSKTSAKTIIF